MDEIEMIRKISISLYALRHEVFCRSLRKNKIKHRDMMVLDAILKKDNRSKMSDLSTHFSISKAAISQEIKRLEELEWIQREPGKKDKRAVYLEVTELGKATLRQEQDEIRQKFVQFIDEIGPEDTQAFMRILDRALYFLRKEEDDVKA